jgi:phage-related minor tail protein
MATALSNLLALLSLDESAYLKGLDSSKKATESFTGNLSSIGGAVVVGALTAIATGVVAVGGAAFDAAETVDAAFDSISVTTGASGDELAILQDDFKKVFSSVPTDAQSAADAISILNSRLDITGTTLQTVATPLLELTRMLGGDIKTNAENFTRVIGDWNIPVEEAAGSLDSLYVASQKTGAPIDALMQQIVQYGAPMRNFGFSFEESAALLASFAAQGVNTEVVMGGLRIAQGKFIGQGKDMNTGLWETVDAIQNAASKTDALTIATEVFGAKAAGDMVDTIMSGKFELDGLVESMMNADGAIMNAASATSDWGEKWDVFKNKMTLGLAPIGEKLREGLGSALDAVVEIFNRPDVQASIATFADFAVVSIGKIVDYIPTFIQGVSDLILFLQNNQGIVVGVFAALGVAALAWGVTTAVAAWTALAPLLPVIGVILLIAAAAYFLYQAWTNNWGGIQEKTAAVVDWIKTAVQSLVDFFMAVWNNPLVQLVVQTVLDNIKALFAAFKAAFNGDWYAFGENLRKIWDNGWNLIVTAFSTIVPLLIEGAQNLITKIIEKFQSIDWGEVGMNIVKGIANGITSAVSFIVDAARSAASAALEAAKGFLGIESPSTLFENEIGVNMGLGLVKGWNSILLGNALTPALATATVDLNTRSAPNAPVSAANQNDGSNDRATDELIRLLRDLPNDLARQVASAVAKSQRVRG